MIFSVLLYFKCQLLPKQTNELSKRFYARLVWSVGLWARETMEIHVSNQIDKYQHYQFKRNPNTSYEQKLDAQERPHKHIKLVNFQLIFNSVLIPLFVRVDAEQNKRTPLRVRIVKI